MSPADEGRFMRLRGFPRVSGDEPLRYFFDAKFPGFSPRERG